MSSWFEIVESGDAIKVQQHLVSNKKQINEVSKDTDECALHISSRLGQLSIAKILLRNGADKDLKHFPSGDTPLHISIKNRHTDIAIELIERGADINSMNKETPLHIAAGMGDQEVVEALLDNRVKFNETTINRETALHYAVAGDNLPIIRLLLNHSDDVMLEVSNTDNHTAMDLACINGNLLIVKQLVQVSLESLSDPILAIEHKHLGIALYLIEKGARPMDTEKALKTLINLHLFHSGNEYAMSYDISSQKRRRTSKTARVSKKQKRLSADVIHVDLLSSQSSEEEEEEEEEEVSSLKQTKTVRDKKSDLYGVTLQETEKLLVYLLQLVKDENIAISLEQHLDAFLFPILKFYQSSYPLLYQLSKQKLKEQGFTDSSSKESSDLGEILDGSMDSDTHAFSGKSLFNGNYDDIQSAAKEMNLPLNHLQKYLHLLQLKKQLIFRGPPGTGKSFLAKNLAKRLITENGEWDMVQFHPNYAYEDFIMGYRPVSGEYSVGYQLKDGPMVQMIRKAIESPLEVFVMVVDEINRGNVCQIFGELFYLLDDRSGSIHLQYSSEKFTLPNNLYLLATMNTADRSIALLDDALMRRFNFVDLHDFYDKESVVYNIFRNWYFSSGLKEEEHVEALFILLNSVNEILDCRDKNLGPSYFMKSNMWPKNDSSVQIEQCKLNMELTWQYSVLPYIHNALSMQGEYMQIGDKLNQIWTNFTTKIFPDVDVDSEEDSMI